MGVGTERTRGVALLHTVCVYLGSDHAGSAHRPASSPSAGSARSGLRRGVIGGLANGEQISPSKVAGCRAELAWSPETARFAREHNDAQVVGVGSWMHGPAGAAEIVEAFLGTRFSGGERHACRIRLVSDFEAAGDAPPMSVG